ncbi:hypothetical protein WICPIJ_004067 [Wickerhamomyces pijperi]|uniref:Vacuolar import and degradation protein n=1 Tax=Wickerhamomyces pijperi TaxID=599730 RepID=A0A9P8Q6K8_WICPI|nr:hypothetical protein WICPIJ_004067 [Wickerhamomyces pijperi]
MPSNEQEHQQQHLRNLVPIQQPCSYKPSFPSFYQLPQNVDSFQSFTTAKRLQALTSNSSSNTSLHSLVPTRSTTPCNNCGNSGNGGNLFSNPPSPFSSPASSSSSNCEVSSFVEYPKQDCLFSAPNIKTGSILQTSKPLTTSYLRPGMTFKGSQHSGHSVYEVLISLKEVDLSRGLINGTLTIKGLTETHPEITTYFEGDLIDGENHQFVTGDYDTSPEIDYAHWSRFPHFNKLNLNKFNLKQYSHRNPLNHEMLYMRWKETFIYTDSKIDSIEGASFAGFYYICFNQNTGGIKGYYYHKSSERFQKLELEIDNGGYEDVENCHGSGFESYQFL